MRTPIRCSDTKGGFTQSSWPGSFFRTSPTITGNRAGCLSRSTSLEKPNCDLLDLVEANAERTNLNAPSVRALMASDDLGRGQCIRAQLGAVRGDLCQRSPGTLAHPEPKRDHRRAATA